MPNTPKKTAPPIPETIAATHRFLSTLDDGTPLGYVDVDGGVIVSRAPSLRVLRERLTMADLERIEAAILDVYWDTEDHDEIWRFLDDEGLLTDVRETIERWNFLEAPESTDASTEVSTEDNTEDGMPILVAVVRSAPTYEDSLIACFAGTNTDFMGFWPHERPLPTYRWDPGDDDEGDSED